MINKPVVRKGGQEEETCPLTSPEQVLTEVLAPYLERINKRRGLTRYMNQCLRYHPTLLPDIICRTLRMLFQTELLFDLSGQVRIDTLEMYNILRHTEDDWVIEVPNTDQSARRFRALLNWVLSGSMDLEELLQGEQEHGAIQFERQCKFQYHIFCSALSIARRVQLLAGRGKCGLHPEFLKNVRNRLAQLPVGGLPGGDR